MENCCQGGLLNTGIKPCVMYPDYITGMILVPLRGSNGNNQYISLTQDPSGENIFDHLNNENPQDRWYPITGLEDSDLPIGDTSFETSTTGVKRFLFDGIRSFTANKVGRKAPIKFGESLKKNRCTEFGVFFIHANGILTGMRDGSILRPFPVNPESFDPKAMLKTVSASQKIMIAFDLDRSADLSKIYGVDGLNDLGVDDIQSITGLIDCEIEVEDLAVVSGNLQLRLVINDLYRGGSVNLQPSGQAGNITGLTASDFDVVIDGNGSAFSGMSELTDGNYTALISPTPGATGDEVVVSILTNTGYVGSVTFTHP